MFGIRGPRITRCMIYRKIVGIQNNAGDYCQQSLTGGDRTVSSMYFMFGAQFDNIVEGLRSCADRMCCVEARCMVLSVSKDIVKPVQFKAFEGSLVHLSIIRMLWFVYRSREIDLELLRIFCLF